MVNGIRKFFARPLSTTADIGADAAFDRRVKAMSEVFFDPQWQPQLKRIRKMAPTSQAAALAMQDLLQSAESEE